MLITCFEFIYILIVFRNVNSSAEHMVSSPTVQSWRCLCMHACMYDKAAPESNQHKQSVQRWWAAAFNLQISPTAREKHASLPKGERGENKSRGMILTFTFSLSTLHLLCRERERKKCLGHSFLSVLSWCAVPDVTLHWAERKMFHLWRNIQTVSSSLFKEMMQTGYFWFLTE